MNTGHKGYCDNTDCKKKGQTRVFFTRLSEDFDNDTCYWCLACRERDSDMLEIEIMK